MRQLAGDSVLELSKELVLAAISCHATRCTHVGVGHACDVESELNTAQPSRDFTGSRYQLY